MGAYWDIAPWIVFAIVDRRSGLDLGMSGGIALAAAVVVTGVSYWRGRRAPVARLGVVLFAAATLGGSVLPEASAPFDVRIVAARAASFLILALVLGASLTGRPLSTSYTDDLVAQSAEGSPAFGRLNQELTGAWALGALAIAASYGALVELNRGFWLTLFGWLVPLAAGAGTIRWVGERWQRYVSSSANDEMSAAECSLDEADRVRPPAPIIQLPLAAHSDRVERRP